MQRFSVVFGSYSLSPYLPAVEQESDLRLVNAYLIKGELIAEFKGNIVILRREAALYLCVLTVGPA